MLCLARRPERDGRHFGSCVVFIISLDRTAHRPSDLKNRTCLWKTVSRRMITTTVSIRLSETAEEVPKAQQQSVTHEPERSQRVTTSVLFSNIMLLAGNLGWRFLQKSLLLRPAKRGGGWHAHHCVAAVHEGCCALSDMPEPPRMLHFPPGIFLSV